MESRSGMHAFKGTCSGYMICALLARIEEKKSSGKLKDLSSSLVSYAKCIAEREELLFFRFIEVVLFQVIENCLFAMEYNIKMFAH